MNRILLKNLGPISNLELGLDKKINIIIGPQASGKSTLGKIKSIKETNFEEDYLKLSY